MAKRNFYIPVETYSVLLSSTESQKAAKARHVLKESYGVPDMFKDFGHGVGKAYSEMSYREKVVYGLALFALAGVVADNVANEGKYTKPVKDKLEKVYEKIVKKTPAVVIGADSVNPLAPTPAPTVIAKNGSATPTPAPEMPFLMYDGIKIIGDEQFQKDNVIWLEFVKKYSLPDYEFIKQNKEMVGTEYLKKNKDGVGGAGAGGDKIYWNKEFLKELIENKEIKKAVAAAAHETGHNTVFNTDRMNETYANIFYLKTLTNLSYVNQSEIDKFYQEFDFSKFKK